MFSFRVPSQPTYTTSIRLTDCEIKAYRKYADSQGLSLSEAIRKAMEEKIANTANYKNGFTNN